MKASARIADSVVMALSRVMTLMTSPRLVTALLTAATLCACSTMESGTRKGLVAHWRGESNGRDAAGNHHASLTGVDFAAGARGVGFALSTSRSRIEVPDSPELDFGPGQEFSISAWIKSLREQTDFGIMDIVDKRLTRNMFGAVGYTLCLDNGRLSCQLAAGPYRDMRFSAYTAPGLDLRDGQFHHVALSVDRVSRIGGALYVDGVQVLTFDPTSQGGDLGNSEPLLIGTHPDPAFKGGFSGVIDEVRVYRRALDGSEVKKLATALTSRSANR